MDDAVLAAMAKWPNVPDCHGWLHLDAHGHWLMGHIDSATPPSRVAHDGLIAFINRNYGAVSGGAWALQNGPQRVWVTLALAPLIVRLHAGLATLHTAQQARIARVLLADDGVVYCVTQAGPAALESASMYEFSKGLSETATGTLWQQSAQLPALPLENCKAADICRVLGFTRNAPE